MASITVSPPFVKASGLADENLSPARDAMRKQRQVQEDTVKGAVTDTPTSAFPGLRIPLEETWRTVSPCGEPADKDALQQTNRTLSPPPLSPHRQGPILTRNRGASPLAGNADSPRTLQSPVTTPFFERLASSLDRTQSPLPHKNVDRKEASSSEQPPRCNLETSAEKFKAAMNSSASLAQGIVGVSPQQAPTGCSVTTQCSTQGEKAHAVMSVPLPQSQAPFIGLRCVSPGVVRRTSLGTSSPLYSVWPPAGSSAASGKTSGSQATAQVLTRLSNGGAPGNIPQCSGARSPNEEGKPPAVVVGEDPLQRLAKELQVLEQLKAAVMKQEEKVRQLRKDVQLVTPRSRPKTIGVVSPQQVAQYGPSLALGRPQAPTPITFPATAPRVNCSSVCRSLHAPAPGSTATAPPGCNYGHRSSASPSRSVVEPRPTQGGSVVLSQPPTTHGEDTKATCSTFAPRGPSPPIVTRKASDAPSHCQTAVGRPSPAPIYCRPEASQLLHQSQRIQM